MAALSTTRQNAIILVALLFVQLVLMSGGLRTAEGATVLESWMIRISSPLVAVASTVGGGFNALGGSVGNLLHAHSRNAALQAEVERLRSELQRTRESALENDRLRRLLGMRDDLVPDSVAASVVTAALTSQTKMIVVDRGAHHGVRTDLPVVSWGGAVGRVVSVGAGHAKVQLLTDPNSGVGAIVQRSRAQGIVVGHGSRRLDLLYVPRFSDVAHGDRVVTSGLDGIFPRGMGIGEVVRIVQAADGSLTVELKPELDYASLEEVLILLEPTAGGLLDGTERGEEGR
jgi:rod shape-determining protein MreC